MPQIIQSPQIEDTDPYKKLSFSARLYVTTLTFRSTRIKNVVAAKV
jgi:hypothetical protein